MKKKNIKTFRTQDVVTVVIIIVGIALLILVGTPSMCEKEDAYFSEKELQCVSLYQKEYVCIQQVNDSDVCKMRTEVEVLKPRLE